MIDKEKFNEAESILASLVCELCGIEDRPTELVANPYDLDVNQKTVMQRLCKPCIAACEGDI